jgi:formylglycine-generating enzyme required for sulfatase activity
MVWVQAGDFLMGSDQFYREERPVHRRNVDGFWIDRHLVTNRAFARFVDATGYRTMAEQQPDPRLYPDAAPSLLAPGSSVFRKPQGPVSLGDYRAWWDYVPAANWRHPEGPGSDISDRMDHPVVHVGYDDARAYAAWAGKSLPTEAEWEFAARGGLDGAAYAWGDEPMPGGRIMANTWQGRFPWENLAEDGYEGTSPAGAFPANGYGLFDMIGNVWEWTDSPVTPHAAATHGCCSPGDNDPRTTRRIVKGGSHLCAPNYCLRFRPAARQAEPIDTSTSHIGFRCIRRPSPS